MIPDYINIKSSQGNYYFHSSNKNQLLLIHPILFFLLELRNKKINISHWIKEIKEDNIYVENIGLTSKEDLIYYSNKFNFLSRSGYFDKQDENISLRFSKEHIKHYLTNTSQISFEVTDNCNLDCDYCIYGKYYTNRGKPQDIRMSFKKAKNILGYIVECLNSEENSSHNNVFWIGFYGGEPLLNMDLIYRIVDYTKQLSTTHNFFNFTLTTNGVLLDKYMDYFEKNNFDLMISLDGGTEENNIYRKYPNKTTAFGKIYKNVLLLKEKHPEYFKKHVSFNSVLHNKNPLNEITEFFQNKLQKNINFSGLDQDSINQDLKVDFLELNKKEFDNKNQLNYNQVARFVHLYSGYAKVSYTDLFYSDSKKPFILTGTCEPFSRKIFITADGKILPCERIGHQFVLGFVDEDGVNLDLSEVAQQYNDYLDRISSLCKYCFNETKCNVCMFKQDIESSPPQCSEFMNYSDISKQLKEYISYLEIHPSAYIRSLTKTQLI